MENNSEKFSFLDILLIFAKRWKLIVISTVLALGLSAGYAKYTENAPIDDPRNKLPDIYAARVIVKADTGSSTSAAVLSSSGIANLLTGGSSSAAVNAEIQFIIKILNGPTLARQIQEAAKDNEWNRKLSAGEIRKGIDTIYKPATNDLLEIRYEDTDRKFAQYMVGVVLEELEKRYTSFSMEKVRYKREFLEQRLATIEADLDEAMARVNEFKEENNIVGMETSQTAGGLFIKDMVYTTYMPKEKRYKIENEYNELNKEVNHFSTLYELLMQQYEAAKMEELDESKIFQVIEPPAYFGRIGPKRDQMVLVITLVTLIAAFVLAFLGSYRDRIVSDPEESEKIAEIKEAFIGKRGKKTEEEDE